MLRAAWLGQRHEPLARRLALLPLLPAAWGFAAGARLHRGLYRSGLRRRRRLPCRVVSVGNLVVGGTGKTPAAAWIAQQLQRRGHKVALASRGYGRRGRGRVRVVSDGRFVHGRAETAGDEPMLLAAHAPGVPVLVGRDRALVGWRAVAAFGAEVVVLDDGFQHHRLHRDIDIVLFDARLGFGNRHVLPRGPLREPLGALRRADAVGVVDGRLAEEDAALLASHAPSALRFEARRSPAALRGLSGGERQDPSRLRGLELGMLCGLAQPASFRATLEALGARVVAERRFPDHHRYRRADLEGLVDQARLWITTEKDAVKIAPTWAGDADLRVLSIEFAVDEADTLLRWIETRLR